MNKVLRAPVQLVLDLLLVSVFALLGRRSHDESLTLGGWWSTAWPFLAGVALGWLLAIVVRRPPASLRGGVVVWVSTIVAAMLLRIATGAGTAAPFVVVATTVTALLLLGSRAAPRYGHPDGASRPPSGDS